MSVRCWQSVALPTYHCHYIIFSDPVQNLLACLSADDLELANDTATFYGFYEFTAVLDGEPVGEVDVDGYSGLCQVRNHPTWAPGISAQLRTR